MDAKSLLVSQLEAGGWTLIKACEDLDGQDFLVRLPNAGESADWIFGHIAVNEDWFLSKLTGAKQVLSDEMHAVYQADFPAPAVRQGLLSRTALLELFNEQRERTLVAVKAADATGWDGPPLVEFPLRRRELAPDDPGFAPDREERNEPRPLPAEPEA